MIICYFGLDIDCISLFFLTADVEPEDIDLGTEQIQDDLAFDVDGDDPDDDPDALDSDDERLNEELGLDAEESDCTFFCSCVLITSIFD